MKKPLFSNHPTLRGDHAGVTSATFRGWGTSFFIEKPMKMQAKWLGLWLKILMAKPLATTLRTGDNYTSKIQSWSPIRPNMSPNRPNIVT